MPNPLWRSKVVHPLPEYKHCTGCNETKLYATGFRTRKTPTRSGHLTRHYCKDCERVQRRDYDARNPQRATRSRHRWRLQREYGMTPEAFHALSELQQNLCAICKQQTQEYKGTLDVDHDHDTGEVRGLLCSHCNRGLGYFRDNPQALRAAADYLERHQRFMAELHLVADAGIAD